MTDSDKGLRILVVEDNPDDQYLLTELLRTSIIKVQLPDIVGTLETAIELLRSTTFDIILLDLLLPDSFGIDTLKKIKEFAGDTPVIILSGINDMKIVAEAIRLGAQDYHVKEELDKKLLTKTILYSIERSHNENNLSKGSDPYLMIKRSELDLMHSSEITKKIMNGAMDAIVCIDISGKIVAWNPQAEKLFGWTQQEILTKKLADTIIPSQYRQAHERGLSNYRATEDGPILNKLIEITARDNKGREFPVELSVIPLKENNHQFFCAFIRDISERKASEEIVKESEEKYRAFFENSLDGILLSTTEGEIWAANPAACRMFDMTEAEICLAGRAGIVDPNDHRLSGILKERKETGKTKGELTFIRKDGSRFPAEISSSVFTDAAGEKKASIIISDITQRKKSEEALIKNELHLRHVLSSTADNFYVIDRNCRILLINESAEKNLQKAWGVSVNIGTNILDIIPNEEDEPIRQSLEKVFAGEKVEYELRLTINELPEWMLVSYMPVMDDNGVVIGAYIMSKDISERKQIEAGLKRSIERFEMIAATTHDAIWEWNLETGEIWGNAVHQQLYGLTASAPAPSNKMWEQKIHPDDRIAILADLQKTLASDKDAWIAEYRFLTSEGYRNIYDRSYIVRNENRKPMRIMGSMMDITERKLIEDFLRESEARNRALVENAPEALVVFDVELRKFVNVSHSAEKLFKMSREELLQIGPIDLSPEYQPDGRLSSEAVAGNISAAIAGDKPYFEWTHCDKDGKTIPCEIWLVRLPSENRILIRGSVVDVSVRKKAELAIKESEEKYRNLIEQASDAIFTYSTTDEKIVSCNNTFITYTGYQKTDIGKLKLSDLLFEDDLKTKPLKFDLVRKGVAVHDERRARRRDGSEMPVELNSKMMPDGNVMVIARDITERKKAEELLRASEEKYRTLVEQAVDAIALYDGSGKILDVNTGSVNLLGYSKEELVGMFLSDILTKEEIKVKPVRYDVLQKGESTVKQRMMRKKNGSIVQTEVRSQQLPDGRFLSVIRDLTERITAQEQIEREKELSDSIINSLPGLFYLIDEKGNYIRWNKLKEQISGYNSEEMSRMNSMDFFEGEEKEMIRQKIKDGFKNGTTEAEAHIITKSGERILFYFTGIAIEYEGQRCLMGTGIDISDRKEAELELESSYKAIRQLTEHLQNIREEERTHIAREIHDELGQKLTVLKMDISWINKKLPENDDVIKTRLKELLLMLDDTVKSVRRISSELRPSLLDDLGLTAAMEWHLNEFRKRFDIRTHFKSVDEILLPEAMKTGLFRIFQESLTNVARHAGAKKVSVSLERENESVVLCVTDDGVGFDKQNAASKKTLGILGMKERTSMIGGTYEIISKPGKGTKVVVTVPLSNKN